MDARSVAERTKAEYHSSSRATSSMTCVQRGQPRTSRGLRRTCRGCAGRSPPVLASRRHRRRSNTRRSAARATAAVPEVVIHRTPVAVRLDAELPVALAPSAAETRPVLPFGQRVARMQVPYPAPAAPHALTSGSNRRQRQHNAAPSRPFGGWSARSRRRRESSGTATTRCADAESLRAAGPADPWSDGRTGCAPGRSRGTGCARTGRSRPKSATAD